MTSKSIAIRVDADGSMGVGHFMRCYALATELKSRDVELTFVCRGLPDTFVALLRTNGMRLLELPVGNQVSDVVDAEETLSSLLRSDLAPTWVVVDHYQLGKKWEGIVRKKVPRILAIDDLGRAHDCDIILDQNLVANAENRYSKLIPADARTMIGPGYALLSPEYGELHQSIPERKGAVEKVLVSFGGADSSGATERVVSSLVRTELAHIEFLVVVPGGEERVSEIELSLKEFTNFTVTGALPNLAAAIAGSDLCIGASGSTNWERLCLGLPAGLVTIAKNQKPVAEELDRLGLARWIGDLSDLSDKDMESALFDLVTSPLDSGWSERCSRYVDGLGARRVATAVTLSHDSRLHARRARVVDEGLILDWANDRRTRQSGYNSEPISEAMHHAWFRSRLREVNTCFFWIIETQDQIPVGQVRFQKRESEWEVNYSVAPSYRGQGIGKSTLECGIMALRERIPDTTILGLVRPENQASCRIFELLNFFGEVKDSETIVYRSA